MASNDVWQGVRALLARRDGYRCFYCGVPTAATVEHLQARANDGTSDLANLRLACCYCNSAKGDGDPQEFLDSGRWRLVPPADLPTEARGMLERFFGWGHREGTVHTGTPQARLELSSQGEVSILVRAGRGDEWHRFQLGPADNARVTLAAWEFLKRHNTPAKPKPFIPAEYRRRP